MKVLRLISMLFLVAGFARFSGAVASPVIPLPIERLTAEADLILYGRVNGISVQRDDTGRIYTKVTLGVDETWRGDSVSGDFTLVHSGGVLGGEQSVTDGEVDFRVGEEVVLFLRINSRGEGVTLGMKQGKFEVLRQDGLPQAYVRNLFHGSEPPKPGDKKGYRLPHQVPLTIQALKRRVTSYRQ